MRITRQNVWLNCLAIFLVLLPLSVFATGDSPQQLVRDTSSRMLAAMRAEQDGISQDPARLYLLVEEIVLPNFDFRRMSQWVLGRNWRTATPQQRELFVVEFRQLLVRTYGSALLEYADEELVYLPFTEVDRREERDGAHRDRPARRRRDPDQLFHVPLECRLEGL